MKKIKTKKETQKTSRVKFEISSNEKEMQQVFENLMSIPDKDAQETLPPNPKRKSSKSSINNSFNRPDDTLDLHGTTREEAIMMLQNFVMQGHRQNLKNLLVITGKGHRSQGKPVLKQAVQAWLKQNGTPYIREFRFAPPHLGGEGATWIDLR